MKCSSITGRCPVAAGECERDGECYIWRCEHEHAPKPEPAAPQVSAQSGELGNASQPGTASAGLLGPADAAASLDDLVSAARCWS